MKKQRASKSKSATAAAAALPPQLVEAFAKDKDVSQARMFNSPGFKIKGKFFATLTEGKLLVKLPEERVKTLIAEGAGEPFEPMRGRVMKEWLLVGARREKEWVKLATEARQFVAAIK